MERIPVRHINEARKEPGLSDSFSIRDIHTLLAGKDMVQELHRHDFFYVLALKSATGNHDIDFAHYTICDNAVFFMRPGQVHQLVLKPESTGYLMQFSDEFYFPREKVSTQLLRRASTIDHYQLNADDFQKLGTILSSILREFAEKKERYEDVIKANMGIFFIGLTRLQSSNNTKKVSLYTQERLEKFLELLETNILSM